MMNDDWFEKNTRSMMRTTAKWGAASAVLALVVFLGCVGGACLIVKWIFF